MDLLLRLEKLETIFAQIMDKLDLLEQSIKQSAQKINEINVK